ncbi:heavy-metal-associated domain-containing protein [Aliiroseovarius sp. KMU-50]|uniref:Heavy-metal-associated domain-containing protein n=1 Tax=Aliiroseovarius salicola TaxID=3009082 RepID=A0ABT4W5R1_9RHOB|nr:heavy-metal-associated domain-containing protein [Aliiroseovarius sp. KMU-50]MDA5095846.1 heavy-metal-associated domain-containing protein [Aliiroseovarius sp. KMU-50]
MSKFHVPDMSCGHCKAAIEKAINSADGEAKLFFDLDARTVDITSQLDVSTLTQILEKEGYPSSVATSG